MEIKQKLKIFHGLRFQGCQHDKPVPKATEGICWSLCCVAQRIDMGLTRHQAEISRITNDLNEPAPKLT